ncbi:MAG TPA: glycosyl hydrolase, partial [Candidatus Dormibacteraeota bacterium]|nr:glycosyl hydrolase [Candidatus Dormibacteraeota bacterium]
ALIIAMRGGGLYVSRDASETWDRLDSGELAGEFTGVVMDPEGALIAASLTEGLLYCRIP